MQISAFRISDILVAARMTDVWRVWHGTMREACIFCGCPALKIANTPPGITDKDKDVIEEVVFEKRLHGRVRFQQEFSERRQGTNYTGSKVAELRSLKADIYNP